MADESQFTVLMGPHEQTAPSSIGMSQDCEWWDHIGISRMVVSSEGVISYPPDYPELMSDVYRFGDYDGQDEPAIEAGYILAYQDPYCGSTGVNCERILFGGSAIYNEVEPSRNMNCFVHNPYDLLKTNFIPDHASWIEPLWQNEFLLTGIEDLSGSMIQNLDYGTCDAAFADFPHFLVFGTSISALTGQRRPIAFLSEVPDLTDSEESPWDKAPLTETRAVNVSSVQREIQVGIQGEEASTVRIFDCSGRCVDEARLGSSGVHSSSVTVPGVYFVVVTYGDGDAFVNKCLVF